MSNSYYLLFSEKYCPISRLLTGFISPHFVNRNSRKKIEKFIPRPNSVTCEGEMKVNFILLLLLPVRSLNFLQLTHLVKISQLKFYKENKNNVSLLRIQQDSISKAFGKKN